MTDPLPLLRDLVARVTAAYGDDGDMCDRLDVAYESADFLRDHGDALLARLAGEGSDTARLDWLSEQADPRLPWIARQSTTGRGFRLHQTTAEGYVHPRAAIDAAMSAPPALAPAPNTRGATDAAINEWKEPQA